MQDLNVAVIGCGAIHRNHLQALRHVPGVTLRAVADIDTARGEKAAAEHGCRYYRDYRELLLDTAIDVVHICTPHVTHTPIILNCLAQGKQVFCEKPAAMNGTEIARIAAAAKAAAVQPGFCYQNRYNPSSLAIRQQLASGRCGEMLSMRAILTWSRDSDYYARSPWRGKFATEGGSLLINQAIHTLDLMQWFAGGAERVKGVVESTFLADATEAEDSAMASLQFHNGARGLFYGSNCYSADAPLLLEIRCENGTLQLQDNKLWLQQNETRRLLAEDTADGTPGKSYWGKGHQQAIAAFYDGLRHPERADYTDICAAAHSLAIVEAIYRSSQLRTWIAIA